ncbi:transmembrane protein 198-like isoform X2 [Dunckerocampus dactyliophorus]|uniref:transmembrane protein 198-like isoform X2 n=1 Tax=Dunckerocampus dactyliophorus TaxID=161453 RepID=UPI0024065748|nr:transmembrane protein 198-like isoform X2 [Dunckerocampus dactyliophorus]XP_054654872.1 transmembrane protein 198-like isoform X2 [Dunckerocampus dactyliophorus]XP_054654881.1 transmembrane protein 198-like isoform X2 [Dunckerocampus dactyliophorus]
MAVTSLNVTEEPVAEVDICMFEIDSSHEVIPSIVCSVCLSFGLIYCFFGYRCFKIVTFFSGFMFGSASVLLLYHNEPVLEAHLGAEAKSGIGLGMGVLCGLVTLLVSTLGILLCGLQLGCLLSSATLVVVGQFYSLTPAWVPLSAIMAASIATAVLTLQWQKLFVIMYTSVFGAITVMLCVDYLVGAFMLPDHVYDMFCQATPLSLCWFNWAISGIGPALSLTGVAVQWKFTAKGASHTEASHKKMKKHAKKHKFSESRRRPPHYRQRRPPPLKRYAGDVLAPSYLRSLQERQMGTGSSSSSVSTITHTLIDFDFETGSMVPLTATSPTIMV